MILLLNTSTSHCQLLIVDDTSTHDHSWEAGRELARELLGRIDQALAARDASMQALTGIGVYQGPGSFTGLRIGLTVANTLADSASLPIVGVSGDNWQDSALARLKANENDTIVLPDYGGDANITTPRK